MDKAEFDRFADAYYDQHRENVAVTGESPEYFAEYKIRQLRQIVAREQVEVSRICDFGSGIGNSIPFFRKYFPDAALTSSDVSERSLTLGKQRYPGDGNYRSDRGQPHPLRSRRVRCRVLGLRVPSHPPRGACDVAEGAAPDHASGRPDRDLRA